MKKLGTAIAALCLLLPLFAGMAQNASIHIEAMSPGRIGTIPTGTFPVSTGLPVVGKGTNVYLSADSATDITSLAWTFISVPAGSTAAFSSATEKAVTFVPDLVGAYVVSVTANGSVSDTVTLTANTYLGMAATGLSCAMCHSAKGTEWAATKHATVFSRGITGQLEAVENEGQKNGVYSTNCIRCHTTGWEENIDNGNYGFEAKKTGFDTTWYQGRVFSGGEYVIPFGDSTQFVNMVTNFPTVAPVATIGCESCHGPGKEHAMAGGHAPIGNSPEAGACLQCHDAPNKHRLGSYWKASAHATMPLSAEEASRSACWPCHNGAAFIRFAANPTTPNYTNVEFMESISCVTCHDPHSDANPNQLRMVTRDKLANGYVVPAGVGGKGQLCMNCHRARTNTASTIAAQARKFGDRFYPHYSPQADMYLGANGPEFGQPVTGVGSHLHLENGCVTCHMATRVNGSSSHSNHEMSMTDATGADIVTACKTCHGSKITSFDDVIAASDYDGNGKVEGVQTEIVSMLATLKAVLPKDSTGEVVTMAKDSAVVKAHKDWPRVLDAMYAYNFVVHDFSNGVHNTKYAVNMLRGALGVLTGIEAANQDVPTAFSLGQNYPNPFNPSTSMQFSVPRAGHLQLLVYNSAGQLVTTLASGATAPGNFTATWNGADNNGVAAPSGMYFYRLIVSNNGSTLYTSTRKMMLVK